MAYSLASDLYDAYQSENRVQVVLFTFAFGTGTYGLWTGLGEITYNGLVYRAGGSFIDISAVKETMDGSVQSLDLSLSTESNKGLSVDILQTFYDEDWHLKPVTIQIGLCDPTTRDLIGVRTVFRGTVDTAPFQESGNEAMIIGHCVSRSLLLSDSGGLYRNSATQKRFDANDHSLDGIGDLGGAVYVDSLWGQAAGGQTTTS